LTVFGWRNNKGCDGEKGGKGGMAQSGYLDTDRKKGIAMKPSKQGFFSFIGSYG
jgi:hypothetical protein